jgi:hypothetical protein
MFVNRVLGRIFEFKRNEVMGDWRKLHNEELQILKCAWGSTLICNPLKH